MAEEEGSSMKKVMIAIDESECSHYALEWALNNLTGSIMKSKVILFTVQSISDYTYLQASTLGTTFVTTAPELIAIFRENQKKSALALLDKAKAICANYGIEAETLTEIGNPKDEICEAVEKYKVQLLVLGSHSVGALKRILLGSVSNYCVHNAKCPVLVVRKPL